MPPPATIADQPGRLKRSINDASSFYVLAGIGALLIGLTLVTPFAFETYGDNAFIALSIAAGLLTIVATRQAERAPVDCQVVNLSAGGACLKLHTMLQLPKRFEFLHGATRNVSQLVWQRGYLVGISYEASADKSLRGYRPSGDEAKQSSLSRRRV